MINITTSKFEYHAYLSNDHKANKPSPTKVSVRSVSVPFECVVI